MRAAAFKVLQLLYETIPAAQIKQVLLDVGGNEVSCCSALSWQSAQKQLRSRYLRLSSIPVLYAVAVCDGSHPPRHQPLCTGCFQAPMYTGSLSLIRHKGRAVQQRLGPMWIVEKVVLCNCMTSSKQLAAIGLTLLGFKM